MYTFSPAILPAIRGHLDAQMSFVDDLSKSMFGSFEKLCALNMQTIRTVLQESSAIRLQPQNADWPLGLTGRSAAGVRPTIDKLRAYQQRVSRISVESQVDLAQVMKKHSILTSRTARTLSDEVARTASEEIERGARTQQDTINSFTDTFIPSTDGADGVERSGVTPSR